VSPHRQAQRSNLIKLPRLVLAILSIALTASGLFATEASAVRSAGGQAALGSGTSYGSAIELSSQKTKKAKSRVSKKQKGGKGHLGHH
jgi:hypothetical protein